ncbi:MAG: ATP-binding protein [bacterium]
MMKLDLTNLSLFELFPDAVLLVDSNFRIIYINSLMDNILGDDLCLNGLKLNDLMPELDLSNDKNELLTKLVRENSENMLIRVKYSKLDGGYCLFSIIPLQELSSLSQAHSDFVSTVSHELRTPLTSLKGFVDTLINSGNRLSEEQKSRFLYIIKSQIERLNRLVENLLTVSRLESSVDKPILKSVNFDKFIDNIIQTIKINANEHIFIKKINKNLPDLFVDSDKLEQIFVNLIDNAVKYSYPKSEIIINADLYDNEFIRIDIEDNGVGIPLDKIKTIFTKFSRIDNPMTRQVQGTGLGLYITKTLVESLGGKIFASNKENGTVFSVLLPMASSENILKRDRVC